MKGITGDDPNQRRGALMLKPGRARWIRFDAVHAVGAQGIPDEVLDSYDLPRDVVFGHGVITQNLRCYARSSAIDRG